MAKPVYPRVETIRYALKVAKKELEAMRKCHFGFSKQRSHQEKLIRKIEKKLDAAVKSERLKGRVTDVTYRRYATTEPGVNGPELACFPEKAVLIREKRIVTISTLS